MYSTLGEDVYLIWGNDKHSIRIPGKYAMISLHIILKFCISSQIRRQNNIMLPNLSIFTNSNVWNILPSVLNTVYKLFCIMLGIDLELYKKNDVRELGFFKLPN